MKKQCKKCGKEKPVTEFFKHKRDGWQSYCKQCACEAMRIYNQTPKRKAYNRLSQLKLKKEGYFKRYCQKPEVKERDAKYAKKRRQNPEERIKTISRWFTNNAIKRGKLERMPCAICGESQSEAHHRDYEKPLLIVWLCRKCHTRIHRKIKEQDAKEVK